MRTRGDGHPVFLWHVRLNILRFNAPYLTVVIQLTGNASIFVGVCGETLVHKVWHSFLNSTGRVFPIAEFCFQFHVFLVRVIGIDGVFIWCFPDTSPMS